MKKFNILIVAFLFALHCFSQSPQAGFIYNVIFNSVPAFQFSPHPLKQTADDMPDFLIWANNEFYKMPGVQDCRAHLMGIFESLPNDTRSFYKITDYSSALSGANFKRDCEIIGSGSNLEDAIANSMINPSLTPPDLNNKDVTTDVHFIEIEKGALGQMYFSRVVGKYETIMKNAFNLHVQKLKTLAEAKGGKLETPESFKYSSYWLNKTKQYSKTLQGNGSLDKMREFDRQFVNEEKLFHNAYQMYVSYKQSQAALTQKVALVSLFLQAAAITADIDAQRSKETKEKELEAARRNSERAASDANKAKTEARLRYEKIMSIRKDQIYYYEKVDIKLDDDINKFQRFESILY